MDAWIQRRSKRLREIENHSVMFWARKGRLSTRVQEVLQTRHQIGDVLTWRARLWRLARLVVVLGALCVLTMIVGLLLSFTEVPALLEYVLLALALSFGVGALVSYFVWEATAAHLLAVLSEVSEAASHVGEELKLGKRVLLTGEVDDEKTSLQELVDENLTDEAQKRFSTDGCRSSEDVVTFLNSFPSDEFYRCWTEFEERALPFVKLGFHIYGYDQYVRWAVERRERS